MLDQNRLTGIDTILLCGEGKASKQVAGERNKGRLVIDGLPLFMHVLGALQQVERIGRIFIVGDKQSLDKAIALHGAKGEKEVVTLQQWSDLMANVWNGFLTTIDGYSLGAEHEDKAIHDRLIFVLPSDCPAISPVEIDQFFDGADMENHDYVMGVTPSYVMDKFAPEKGKPGVKMAYFHLAEGLFRINNMHLARPFAFHNRAAIQKLYNSRYQITMKGVLRLARDIWAIKAVRRKMWVYLFMQTAMRLRRFGLSRVSDFIRKFVSLDDAMEAVELSLGLRATCVITTDGGAALDVDNTSDYMTIRERFSEWKGSTP